MIISGFTIVRNAVKYNYPFLESINSILPICDEFVINVGDCEDNTLELLGSLKSPKIRIIQNKWDLSQGKTVLAQQTNLALKACQGDWAFYLQSDELIHEEDLPRLKKVLDQHDKDPQVEALRFQWLHFYGSYYRYRIDHGWFQKQDRIIRNNGQIESFDDAYGFKRKDDQVLKRKNTGCLLYHYGWVHPEDVMTQRRVNAEKIGFTNLKGAERNSDYVYGDLDRFAPYFGSHPAVMTERIKSHLPSQADLKSINRFYWWHPLRILKVRYKTGKRIKQKIN